MGYKVFLSFIYLDQLVVIPIELNKMYIPIAQKTRKHQYIRIRRIYKTT